LNVSSSVLNSKSKKIFTSAEVQVTSVDTLVKTKDKAKTNKNIANLKKITQIKNGVKIKTESKKRK
jgi:hypothetical protein